MQLLSEQPFAIARDFCQHFQFVIADTEQLRGEVYRVRYQVFCEELGYGMAQSCGYEHDEYDADSLHVLLRDQLSGTYIGCFRLVFPQQNGSVWLPMETYGVPHIDKRLFDCSTIKHPSSVEVSRLALTRAARHPDRATASPSSPYLAPAMFYAASALIVKRGIENVFMVIEPVLARLTSRFGIRLDQISPPFPYYGQRATFVTSGHRLANEARELRTAWRHLYEVIEEQLFTSAVEQEVA